MLSLLRSSGASREHCYGMAKVDCCCRLWEPCCTSRQTLEKSNGHTCLMRIVFMERSVAMHIGQQLLMLSPLKERAKPHAASTLPGHARCRMCPALCLSSLGGPKRVCVQLASRPRRLHDPRDHTLFHGRNTRENSHCPSGQRGGGAL